VSPTTSEQVARRNVRSVCRIALGLAIALVSSSCTTPSEPSPRKEAAPPNPPVERQWQSEHFRYLSRTGDSVCKGVTKVLERHFATLQSYLDFEWPSDRRITYYKYLDDADLDENGSCSPFNSACFYAEHGVQTASGLQTHELVHAYLAPTGRRHLLVEEGLAQSLSCGPSVPLRPQPVDVDVAFEPSSWQSNDLSGFRDLYASAQWFVGWLLRTRGPKPFMHWYQALNIEHDHAVAATSFETVYGGQLDEAWTAAFTSEDPDTGCVRVWECASSPFESLPLTASCDQTPNARTVDVEQAAWFVQRSERGGLMVSSCGTTPPPAHQGWLRSTTEGQAGDAFAIWLEPGRYFVAQSARFGDGEFRRLEATAPAPPDECPAQLPLSLDFEASLTIGLRLEAAGTNVRPLELGWRDRSMTGRGYEVRCAEGTSATWCNSCEECTAACDSSVAVAPETATTTTRTLRIDGADDRAHWVRIHRTY